jgi:hypothetical protein
MQDGRRERVSILVEDRRREPTHSNRERLQSKIEGPLRVDFGLDPSYFHDIPACN